MSNAADDLMDAWRMSERAAGALLIATGRRRARAEDLRAVKANLEGAALRVGRALAVLEDRA